jgi:DNA replication protein DnaC
VSAFYGRLGKEVAEETYEQATRAQVLILDDLGWGNKGGAMDAIFEVMAQRHGDGRPTIWTSNTEPHQLAQTNAPMLRRLAEGRIVRFDERHEWRRT